MLKKNKIISIAIALSLGASIFSIPFNTANKTEAKDSTLTYSQGAPFDLGVANDDRLIEMMKNNGYISNDASVQEAQSALKSYLQQKSSSFTIEKGELYEHESKRENTLKDKLNNNGLMNGKGNKLGHAEDLEAVELEEYSGSQRKDDILVLLIEYPDFPHNSIAPENTDMYYEDYTKEHYDEMIFGNNGYIGPNGESLLSVKQYYEQQSGGSYTIDGEVAGWYMATQPAAYYGGVSADARKLVKEALEAVAMDPSIDLSTFDQEDRYDLDGDGNYREPDGLIDHLMVVHSSVGEEAGGGALGEDAIWSHRWNLGNVTTLPGTVSDAPYWNGQLAAYDYTIEPADGAAGVFAHEYGHDLGLPDEYDTQYSGEGEPVSYWSVMSSGSWAGQIPGTEPTGFSPWAKEFLHASMGGNWLTGSTIHLDDIDSSGVEGLLDQASSKGTNNDTIRIDLPPKEVIVNTPYSGEYEYYSGKGDELDHSMSFSLDLANATSSTLQFKAWYEIEENWDYASIQVKVEGSDNWVAIPGNITTDYDPYDQNPGHGITGHSDGWIDASFDLSTFAGQNIDVRFNYWTDVAAIEAGIFIDDIETTVDRVSILFDNVEGDPLLTLDGFTKHEGKLYTDHYYLLEWRNHEGVDEGLAHIRRGNSLMTFDPGLVIWYVDNEQDNNWTGFHPGEGFLGVVDADQHTVVWSDHSVASTRFQIHDAAFSLNKSEDLFLDYEDLFGITITDNFTQRTPLFDDSESYLNLGLVDAGRDIPSYGLKIRVIGESPDGTVGKILISR
ncbi:immune inhibitor A domain-containing protein [Chengkuizengella sediminis]|uniref:immune inhibitor A domain-containing protein n=1 Tax=Chengkuizengella sediminis TaxID=1885917 RepID=UPI00196AE612|nr:immune inhibitor A domain-containing protein [Chengkuizengella sediminis]